MLPLDERVGINELDSTFLDIGPLDRELHIQNSSEFEESVYDL